MWGPGQSLKCLPADVMDNLGRTPGAFGRNEDVESLQVQSPTPKSLRQQLVLNTWPLLKTNAAENGFKMFQTMFDIVPTVKDLFSFLRNSNLPLDHHPRFKQHALLVFNMVGDTAVEQVEKGSLDEMRPIMLELARTHIGNGVVDAHFDLMKFALLRTIEEALPDLWSLELNMAWTEAFEEVAEAIKREMNAQQVILSRISFPT